MRLTRRRAERPISKEAPASSSGTAATQGLAIQAMSTRKTMPMGTSTRANKVPAV